MSKFRLFVNYYIFLPILIFMFGFVIYIHFGAFLLSEPSLLIGLLAGLVAAVVGGYKTIKNSPNIRDDRIVIEIQIKK